jgi:hypothetical protein
MEKGSRNNLKGAVFAARQTIEWMRDNTDYTTEDKEKRKDIKVTEKEVNSEASTTLFLGE